MIPGVGVTGAPNDDRGCRAGRFQLAVAVDQGGERVLVERDVVVELQIDDHIDVRQLLVYLRVLL